MNPKVSICCITYNQENYIKDAIESFLNQIVDFPIEIIIHDDASSDATSEIIREYERKFPEVIKPIYQKENQYSKGMSIFPTHVWPHAKGQYIALCEGDDFWTDPYKLQKQVDFLENNKNHSMCFHSVRVVNTLKENTDHYIGPHGKGSKNTSITENVIAAAVHLSSIVMRSNLVHNKLPEWYMKSRHEDFVLCLFLSVSGETYFIDEVMSSYRLGVENSLMTTINNSFSIEKEIEYQQKRIQIIEEADRYYEFKYHNELLEANKRSEVKILILNNQYLKLMNTRYKNVYKEDGIVKILKTFASFKFPKTIKRYSKLKHSLKSQT